jgi:GTP-binding protein
LAELLKAIPRVELMPAEVKVFRPPEEAFTISYKDGAWRIEGAKLERLAAMTNWELDEAVQRFQRIIARMGVTMALREAGVKEGDTVYIGETELEWIEIGG